ncbi:hypothetical protein D3C86_1097330 [compost metagenome]
MQAMDKHLPGQALVGQVGRHLGAIERAGRRWRRGRAWVLFGPQIPDVCGAAIRRALEQPVFVGAGHGAAIQRKGAGRTVAGRRTQDFHERNAVGDRERTLSADVVDPNPRGAAGAGRRGIRNEHVGTRGRPALIEHGIELQCAAIGDIASPAVLPRRLAAADQEHVADRRTAACEIDGSTVGERLHAKDLPLHRAAGYRRVGRLAQRQISAGRVERDDGVGRLPRAARP